MELLRTLASLILLCCYAEAGLMLVADGTQCKEVTPVVEAFSEKGISLDTVSVMPDKKNITCQDGETFEAKDNSIPDDLDKYKVLIIPGGAGVANFKNENIAKLIGFFEKNNKKVAAICAGPEAVQHAGAFRGRTLTAYKTIPGYDEFYTFSTSRIVVDYNLITGQNVNDANGFAEQIVKEITK